MSNLVVIGGSDAGISAALRARELSPGMDVTVLLADSFPNFSICGLPYLISGEVSDWQQLAHRDARELTTAGIDLQMDCQVTAVDVRTRQVTLTGPGGPRALTFDRLVIATGARPMLPRIEGLDLPGVFPLRTMSDAFRVIGHLANTTVRRAAIVGGGYIGMETAEAFAGRGIAVTVFEHGPRVMKTLDDGISAEVARTLDAHGVAVVLNSDVRRIAHETDGLRLDVAGATAPSGTWDLVLMAVGVEPEVELARAAGVALGARGAIAVNARMETNVPNVLAAGDCATTFHRLTQQETYLPLGTTAHKQGRVAGENAAGGDARFAGVVGTQVVKLFDNVVARTGLTDEESRLAGFDPLSATCTVPDHKRYYPGARDLLIQVSGDRASGRLLGGQMFGDRHSGVAKRIDLFAAAIHHSMNVDALLDLDLSYAPPLGSPWDPAQLAAEAWCRARRTGS